MRRTRFSAGFTLVEMVTVIVIGGILAAVAWRNISQPITGFEDSTRRAQLVDVAESALHRMTSEIRLAAPNSIRISTVGAQTSVEFLRTLTGGRYRAAADPVLGGNVLSFTAASGTFDALGGLPSFGPIATGASQNDCLSNHKACLVIFNTGAAGANAYNGDNIAVVTAATATTVSFNITPKSNFPFSSPSQRFDIVDTPVSFICNTATGQITRYDTYAITAAQAVPPVGAVSSLLTNQVAACTYSYAGGTATRAGLVTISLTVRDPSATGGGTMQVTLLDQAHVLNVP